jgi:SNF2 family DNA or RNA helicase
MCPKVANLMHLNEDNVMRCPTPILKPLGSTLHSFARASAADGGTCMQAPRDCAKLQKLMKTLRHNEESSKAAGGAPIKSVVFSQFMGMLSLVTASLERDRIPHMRIDGTVPAAKRHKLLNAFAEDTEGGPRVAVVSLRACGVGLNLVSASQVHLLDPWWNPATEDQAMDRVHRIGQRREVTVFRYAPHAFCAAMRAFVLTMHIAERRRRRQLRVKWFCCMLHVPARAPCGLVDV